MECCKNCDSGDYNAEEEWINACSNEACECHTDPRLKEFINLVYEPEHTSTVCWCKPEFRKRKDGRMQITHNEQRDTLTEFIKKNFL